MDQEMTTPQTMELKAYHWSYIYFLLDIVFVGRMAHKYSSF